MTPKANSAVWGHIFVHIFAFYVGVGVVKRTLVAPYRAILRYYPCDTPYRAILLKGSQHSPKIQNDVIPPLGT